MARKRIWAENVVNESTTSSGADTLDLTAGLGEIDFKGYTLVRMIIDLTLGPLVFAANSLDSQRMSLGVAMVSDEAAIAGAFPDPNTTDRPLTGWLWRAQAPVSEDPSVGNTRIMADIRTQRKLMYGVPYLTIFNDAWTGAGPFEVQTAGIFRCLFLRD